LYRLLSAMSRLWNFKKKLGLCFSKKAGLLDGVNIRKILILLHPVPLMRKHFGNFMQLIKHFFGVAKSCSMIADGFACPKDSR